MADYSHRYETGDDMLADLAFVASAADPATVRPADLPSVRGGGVAASVHDTQPDDYPEMHVGPAVGAAGSPRPATPSATPAGAAGVGSAACRIP